MWHCRRVLNTKLKAYNNRLNTQYTHSANVITFSHEQIVITSYQGRVPKAPSPFL